MEAFPTAATKESGNMAKHKKKVNYGARQRPRQKPIAALVGSLASGS